MSSPSSSDWKTTDVLFRRSPLQGPIFTVALLASATWLLTGCGDGRPPRAPVSGQVLIDGKPLVRGHVRFVPTDGRASIGTLDAEGRFTLRCFEDADGALLGTHRVAIEASEWIGETEKKWHAPKKYANPASSGLEYEVGPSQEQVLFELTWQGNGNGPFVERLD